MTVRAFGNEVLIINPDTYQLSVSPNIWLNQKFTYFQAWDTNFINNTDDRAFILNKVPTIYPRYRDLLFNAFSDTDKKEILTLSLNIYNLYSNVRDLTVNLLDNTDVKFIGFFGSAGIGDKILAGDYAYTSHFIVFDINDVIYDICPSPHMPMHKYDSLQTVTIVNAGTTYTLDTVPQDYLHELFILSNLPISIQAIYVRAMSLDYPYTAPAQYYDVLFFAKGDIEWTNITLAPYNFLQTPTALDITFKFYFGVTVKSTSGIKEKIALVFDIWYI